MAFFRNSHGYLGKYGRTLKANWQSRWSQKVGSTGKKTVKNSEGNF
jgi:hypothetical protein